MKIGNVRQCLLQSASIASNGGRGLDISVDNCKKAEPPCYGVIEQKLLPRIFSIIDFCCTSDLYQIKRIEFVLIKMASICLHWLI
jgi:hypothetical protein